MLSQEDREGRHVGVDSQGGGWGGAAGSKWGIFTAAEGGLAAPRPPGSHRLQALGRPWRTPSGEPEVDPKCSTDAWIYVSSTCCPQGLRLVVREDPQVSADGR